MSRSLLLTLALVLVCATCTVAADIELTPGLPVRDSVETEGYAYFYVVIPDKSKALTVSVTPLSEGDPDLYASTTTEHPTEQTPGVHIARGYGKDSVTISNYDPASNKVYVTVFGWRAVSNFTVLANFDDPVILEEGIPQVGSVVYEQESFYNFTVVDPTVNRISISLTPTNGFVRLLVSNTNTYPDSHRPSSYQWSTIPGQSDQTLTLRRSDGGWPANGRFLISVQGVTDSSYTITAGATALLRDGIPLTDHTETGEHAYYKVLISSPQCALTVTVTPITGDPDLYVSAECTHPSATSNCQDLKTSTAFGEDEVTIADAKLGYYYIGVVGWVNSTFTVTAYAQCGHDDEYITLVDGSPSAAELDAGHWRYYKFSVGSHHDDVTFSVSRRFGDPDLYVALDHFPTVTNFTWRSISWGEDLITIDHVTDPNKCFNCDYWVGVYAVTDTAFSITAATSETITTLQNGVPLREDLRAGEYEYFQLPVDLHGEDLTVTVTDLAAGDPDLFISTKYHHPNETNAHWRAQRLRGDSITISHDAGPPACSSCVYYISVHALVESTFTIVATFENTTRLSDGVPQQGSVAKGAFKYYEIQLLASDHEDIEITLSTTSGFADLFVGTQRSPDGTPESYQWVSHWYSSSKSITIDKTDPNRCVTNDCRYYIGVRGETTSEFTLVAATNMATIALQNGIPQREHVGVGGWEYFSFDVLEAGKDVTFSVTPLSGDPDMFITIPPNTNPRPNATTADKSARGFGGDIAEIDNATVGTYYIGVNAFTESIFSIVAVTLDTDRNDENSVADILDGEPQYGFITRHHFQYFRFTLAGRHTELTITVGKVYGDPDLYVNKVVDEANPVFPKLGSADFASNSFERDIIRITPDDIEGGDLTGTYLIGVYGFTAARFTVTAASNSISTTLQDGVPVQGILTANQYDYFQLPVDSFDRDITITVTPLSGDPDLYVSTKYPHPNQINSTWSGFAWRGDSVVIPHTEADFCTDAPCVYYIAVYAYTYCTYQVMATFSKASLLEDGVPQEGSVARHGIRYYLLHVNAAHSDLTISTTARYGETLIMMKRGGEHAPTYQPASYDRITTIPGEPLIIRDTIPDTTYYIGVYGVTNSSYTLTAKTDLANVELQDGVPVRAWVDTGKYYNFMFNVPVKGLELTIVVTPITGDPDLYVSDSIPRPDRDNARWSASAAGGDIVIIENANNTSPYYIAVHAYINSTFTVTAYAHDPAEVRQVTALSDGLPQDGYVKQYGFRYYQFILDGSSSEVSVSVTRRVGDPDLYVLNNASLPTRDVWWKKSSSFGRDLVTFTNAPAGTYTIGIFGYTASYYTVTYTAAGSLTTLLDGVPFTEFLLENTYEYFVLPVDRLDRDLTVSVTAFNGDPDLFISTNVTHPDADHHDYQARRWLEDSITIPNHRLTLGNYYISVSAFTNTTYTVVASFANTSYLENGQPQAGYVPTEGAKYYIFDVDVEHTDIEITLTPFTGRVYLFVSDTQKPERGNPHSYRWASVRSASSQTVLIPPTEQPEYCTPFCRYYVMVYGVQVSFFQVVAATSKSTVPLVSGVPQRQHVGRDDYMYFSYEVDNPMADIHLSVTPFTGDPDIYVSLEPQIFPTFSNFTWRSALFGADSLTIRHTDTNFRLGTYHIGVYAYTNSIFTILATNDVHKTVLINGVPQTSHIDLNSDRKFFSFKVEKGHKTVTFSVTPFTGEVDLYVRDDDDTPTPEHYQWKADSEGRDEVVIKDGCRDCTYTITVVPIDSPTQFDLVALTDDVVTQLSSGTPVVDFVLPNEYVYFAVDVDEHAAMLGFSLTAYTGDPDLYVSTPGSHITRPNATHYNCKSISFGSDTLTLPNSCPTLGEVVPGTYYVAVSGFLFNSSFGLTATLMSGPRSAQYLVNGETVEDFVYKGENRLYALRMNYKAKVPDVTLTISTNNVGSAVLYVTSDGTTPTPEHFQYTTFTPSGNIRDVLSVTGCRNCTYLIAVHGSQDTAFRLTATTTDENSLLVAGKPIQAHVRAGKFNYYKYIVDRPDRDIQIYVTTYSGDADLFVDKTHQHPNLANSTWRSMKFAGYGDYVNIMHNTTDFLGVYYVGVRGADDSTYSITVTNDNLLLNYGTPQRVESDPDGSFFFIDEQNTQEIAVCILDWFVLAL
jgi:hypothetical protein